MPWSNFDYQTQVKVIDKIHLLSEEEDNWRIANALRAAALELEIWSDNHEYGKDPAILENFVDSGKTPIDTMADSIKEQNHFAQKFVTIIFAVIGAVVGALMINDCHQILLLVGALLGAWIFGLFGHTISSKKK
jgi:hypothetical protein